MDQQSVPEEIERWARNALNDAYVEMTRVTPILDLHKGDQASWARHLIETLRSVEEQSGRVRRFLEAWSVTDDVLPLATVARAAGVTPNGMRKRITSPGVQETWAEVLPDREPPSA
jgi:hypothetical protein